MEIKKLILILLGGLVLLTPINAVTIESVVYNFRIEGDKLEGVSLIVVRADEALNEITFYSEGKVTFFNEELGYEKENSEITIKNLSLKKKEKKELFLKLESIFSGPELVFPLFRFPYPVEKSLLGVEKSKNKFVWKIDFPAYEVQDDDKVIIQEKVSPVGVEDLDKEILKLKNFFNQENALPEYRIYLEESQPDDKEVIRGWSGKSYQFYLPNIIPVMVISLVLLVLLYFILKRPIFSLERKREKEEEKEFDWLEIKTKGEKIMEKLEGNEKLLYQEIFNSEGEILQRELPERLEFSKAKVTRILDSLERRGLIERKSYGVTNKVVLK